MSVKDVLGDIEKEEKKVQATDAAAQATDAKKFRNEFRQAGEAALESLSEEQKASLGSKSDAVAFVNVLCDPSLSQTWHIGGEKKPGWQVCGYRLKALEALEIPKVDLVAEGATKKNKTINVDYTNVGSVSVAAGQEFIVNLVELAMLISKAEFDGRFTGEGKTVYVSMTKSDDVADPKPNLNLLNGQGSIKDGYELVADDAGNGKYVVKEEFAEKFAPLFIKPARMSKGGSTKSKNATGSAFAAAFREFYSKKLV